MTADRGCSGTALISTSLKLGISSIFIMPQHLLRCHPFVGKSFFNATRNDFEKDCEKITTLQVESEKYSNVSIPRDPKERTDAHTGII